MIQHEGIERSPVVLIADDDELMRSLLVAALMEKGFEPVEVENGLEAVAKIPRLQPDLVLLDVDMPVMDGYEACKRIRTMEAGRDLPVVIVTGNEDTESIDHAFDCGATDFISKPVNWSLIGYRMRYVLRGAETRSALANSEARNRALLEALPDRLVLASTSGDILAVIEQNRAGAASGQPTDAFQGKPLTSIFPEDVASQTVARIGDVLSSGEESVFEFSTSSAEGKNAEDAHYEVRILPQAADVALLILRDITQRKRTEEQIHRLAFYDSLTSLPNRHYFMQRADAALSRAAETQDAILLCYFNLDHFNRINDTLGHSTGDSTLREVADRLTAFCARWRDQGYEQDVARLGGDEFALLSTVRGTEDATRLLQALRSEFAVPITCDRHQLVITISVGSTLYPTDGEDIESLMLNADKAMSSAKQIGRDAHIAYSRSEHERSQDVLQLETELRRSIERDELALYFQPKFDLQTGALSGAEALLRWNHCNRGMVSPAAFIPIAEETGLIVDIDRWVADRSCSYLRDWRSRGLNPVPVSINLSGREFCFDQPEITLQRAMHAHGIDPELLEIEITETVLMADPAAASRTLASLNAMGIRLAVDDFGTGYSSLSYLKRFPLDVLKIDREFVSDLEEDPNDQALCRAMISMARSLSLEVVAEGIETEGQREFLRHEGCHIGQGYLLSRPMAAEDYEALLLERSLQSAKFQPELRRSTTPVRSIR